MRHAWLLAVLALPCWGYKGRGYGLTGRIDPPAAVAVFLHGATSPFESSTESTPDGRFRFSKIPAGTYTFAILVARDTMMQTVELSPGTIDSKGRLDIVVQVVASWLESGGDPSTGFTVSITALSVPNQATREYDDAQRCLSRRDGHEAACASTHLRRAVEIAPRFTAAWNQLGTIAYQSREYSDAETNFRRALEADPEAFEPLVNLGGALLNLARPREALGYNLRAVARRPNDALANSQLGLTYFYLNDPDQAERYLKLAVQLDPAHFSHPQLPLAEIYLKRGDRQSALLELRDFLNRHPDAPQAVAVWDQIAALSR